MAAARETSALCTVRDFVRWGASEFGRAGLYFGHGSDNPLDEAFHLVAWTLKLPFDLPTTYLDARLTTAERRAVLRLLRARVRTRKPAAYLMGEAWFAGLPFHVDERVLIPRSPIAELIEHEFAPWLTEAPRRILDLCAGSGCIGIACAIAWPTADVELAELDRGALAVCRRNIDRHGLGERVHAVASDLFAAIDGRYDLIITNPPYVPAAEWRKLPPEFHHEPRKALEAGSDGMDLMARILAAAPRHLEPGGLLIGEVGGSVPEFEARFPGIPVTWPSFERGGDGVFIIGREALEDWLRQTKAMRNVR